MKRNHLIALFVAALVLGGIAYTTSRKNAAPAPSRMGELLLKDIPLNNIATIRMINGDDATVLTRAEGGWVVTSRHGYPANYDRLHRAVVALSELKVDHGLDVTEKQKADMHITDTAPRVQFRDAADALLAEIILGDPREQEAQPGNPYGGYPNGRFVSTDGGKSVVVVSATLDDFTTERSDAWLDSDLFSLDAADVVSITVSGGGRDPMTLARSEADNTLTLSDLKEGEAVDTAKLRSAESALSYMRFSDVADPTFTDAQLGMTDPVVFEATTTSNVLYTVRLGAKPEGSEDRYARISVAYIGDDESAVTDEEGEPDEAARLQREKDIRKTREEATALNDLFSRWTYVLPSYKVETLTTQRSDFIKKAPTDETTDAASATVEVAEPTVDDSPGPEVAPAAPVAASPQPVTPEDGTTEPVDPGSK